MRSSSSWQAQIKTQARRQLQTKKSDSVCISARFKLIGRSDPEMPRIYRFPTTVGPLLVKCAPARLVLNYRILYYMNKANRRFSKQPTRVCCTTCIHVICTPRENTQSVPVSESPEPQPANVRLSEREYALARTYRNERF